MTRCWNCQPPGVHSKHPSSCHVMLCVVVLEAAAHNLHIGEPFTYCCGLSIPGLNRCNVCVCGPGCRVQHAAWYCCGARRRREVRCDCSARRGGPPCSGGGPPCSGGLSARRQQHMVRLNCLRTCALCNNPLYFVLVWFGLFCLLSTCPVCPVCTTGVLLLRQVGSCSMHTLRGLPSFDVWCGPVQRQQPTRPAARAGQDGATPKPAAANVGNNGDALPRAPRSHPQVCRIPAATMVLIDYGEQRCRKSRRQRQ